MLNGRRSVPARQGLAFPTPGVLDCPPWRQRLRAPGARLGLGSVALGNCSCVALLPASMRAGQKPARARSPRPQGPFRCPRPPPCQVPGGCSRRKNRAVFRFRPAPATPWSRLWAWEKGLTVHAVRLAPCSTCQGCWLLLLQSQHT